jgi:AAHS family benzoate transporter-like MFS transporter
MSLSRSRAAGSRTVVLTCLAVTILDGVDLFAFGAVLPILLQEQVWGMTTVQAGLVGSLSVFGMMIGAMLAGYLTDVVGRRPIVLGCVVAFSVFTGLCAIAPSLEVFAVLRLLAGLGFGGALPTVIALTMEYARLDRRQSANGVVQTGFPIGGAIVSILAIFAVPSFGWESLFAAAGLVGVLSFLVAWRCLPESAAFLVARGRHEEAQALVRRYDLDAGAESGLAVQRADAAAPARRSAFRLLTAPGYRVATVLFPLISFLGLLVGYGMNTWTPQILRSMGYDLGSALSFLLAFNLGSAAGMLVLTGLADRFGPRRVIASGFLMLSACVAVLTLGPAQGIVFALVLLIGFCVASQSAMYGFVGVHYPPAARGTALGLVTGLGRLGGVVGPILVGVVIGAPAGATGVFWTFAGLGLAAAVLVALVPRGGGVDGGTRAAEEPAQQRAT